MNIVFRVDASARIGTGHLIRCLALAEALRDRGVDTRFISRVHPGNLLARLYRQAMPVTVLPAAPNAVPQSAPEDFDWLGVPQAQDAEETIAALQGERSDWLIVDHYGLDAQWEHLLRPEVNRIMVIDDLANRRHDCDFLLDQNFAVDKDARYRGLLPNACPLLVGPRYALLRPEYAVRRRTLQQRNGHVRRVLVFLGGSDPGNVSATALEVLSSKEFRHLRVEVVVGANNPHRAVLEDLAARRPLTTLHGPKLHLADLMSESDLAIGAGGTTTWERLCLGLPTLVVSMADNQIPACTALAEAKLIRYEGDVTSITRDQLRATLHEMIADEDALAVMSTAGQIQVDGLGALRVAEALEPTKLGELRLRPADHGDVTLYFNWVNDPEVRRQAIKNESISWSAHREWFRNKLADAKDHLFVLQAGRLPVGQIRFDRENDEARISYSLDPFVRGRGWAAHLVGMGAKKLEETESVILRAEVKSGNQASYSVFQRLGFEKVATPQGEEGTHVFLSPCSRIASAYSLPAFSNEAANGSSPVTESS